MDHFISMYIDDELSLDEKIQFVKTVYGNKPYTDEAIVLLKQEKELSALITQQVPNTVEAPPYRAAKFPLKRQTLGWAVAAGLIFVLSFIGGRNMHLLQTDSSRLIAGHKTPEQQVVEQIPRSISHNHRFVIRQHGTQKVEITGSFTGWQKVPLLPTGSDDYWEVTLPISSGEHRYSFIVDGSKRLPDPTVQVREADDFGTINSIINIES